MMFTIVSILEKNTGKKKESTANYTESSWYIHGRISHIHDGYRKNDTEKVEDTTESNANVDTQSRCIIGDIW